MDWRNMSKVVFVSTTNIYDASGNGGVKASREHYNMLADTFGIDNVLVILIVRLSDYKQLYDYPKKNLAVFKYSEGYIIPFLGALFGYRAYMPWQEHSILNEIRSFNPELVFLDFSVAGRLIRRLKSYKTICFFHNVEADYTFNKVRNEGWFYYPAFFAAKRNDKWALKANYVMAFNERDSKRLSELYGRGADFLFPISLEDRFEESKCVGAMKKKLLFCGSCFGPNEDGIDWFIKKVMPKLSGITLDLIGQGFEKKKEKYMTYSNVNVIGTVRRTDDYYYTHNIVVMPIRYGAGMKVKTAEAMMFGRTIIASDEALEGYDISDVSGIYRCNKAEEYVKAIEKALNEYPTAYKEEVRERFKEKYSTSAISERFKNEVLHIVDMNEA